MAKFLMSKTPVGLAPASAEATEYLRKKKLGATVMVDVVEPRNAMFHRKYFALLELAYDYWSETCEPMEYKGRQVRPDFERFRKDVVISAGFYNPVVNLKGELRIEPESLAFGSMTQERFDELYNATIAVLLSKVFNGARVKKWTENELRGLVDQVMSFAA